jgi:hypothetical protein
MNLEAFNKLTEAEQSALLTTIEDNAKTISDLTAERDSLRTENTSLKEEQEKTAQELKQTKELNFTLARKVDKKPHDDIETVLHNFIKGE